MSQKNEGYFLYEVMKACFIAHFRVKVGAVLELATDGPGSSLYQTALPHWCLEAGVWEKNSVAVVTASVLFMSERGPTVERTAHCHQWVHCECIRWTALAFYYHWLCHDHIRGWSLYFFFKVILLFFIFSFTYCIRFWFEKRQMVFGQIKK